MRKNSVGRAIGVLLFLGLFVCTVIPLSVLSIHADDQTDIPHVFGKTAVGALFGISLEEIPDPVQGTTPAKASAAAAYSEYVTAPLDLPIFTVERGPGRLGDGYLFVSTIDLKDPTAANYNLILDNQGEPIFYDRITKAGNSLDFKMQPSGLLTYYTNTDSGWGFEAMDSSYTVVKDYVVADDPETGRDYQTDQHDLQIMSNGNALHLIYDWQTFDMSQIYPGGNPEATVIGCVIQELDKSGSVVFQWRSWDYLDEIEITDTNRPLDDEPLRYIHCNSIDEDFDGNLLMSSRNLDEIIKIARPSGEIMWRMGGRKNEFEFLNDSGFTVPHDVRRLPNGNITLYDNADLNLKTPSRGVEYRVDEVNKKVSKVAEFYNTPATYGYFMGNVQRLANGNTLIGWGASNEPLLTEFDGHGQKVFEVSVANKTGSYRAFRFPWQGYPVWTPRLEARLEGNTAHLYFSWNGSTDTGSYKIFTARRRQSLRQIDTVSRDGFETEYLVELPTEGTWYFQVVPVNRQGIDGTPSNIAHVIPGGTSAHLPIVASP